MMYSLLKNVSIYIEIKHIETVHDSFLKSRDFAQCWLKINGNSVGFLLSLYLGEMYFSDVNLSFSWCKTQNKASEYENLVKVWLSRLKKFQIFFF